jgi:ATP-dependent Clp protease ATP-binding subunit ClpC
MLKRVIAAVLASILVTLPPGQAAAAQLGRLRAGGYNAGATKAIVPVVNAASLGAAFKPALNATLNSGLPVLTPGAQVSVPGAQTVLPAINPLAAAADAQHPVTIHQKLAELSAELAQGNLSEDPQQGKQTLDGKFDAGKKRLHSSGDDVRGSESGSRRTLQKGFLKNQLKRGREVSTPAAAVKPGFKLSQAIKVVAWSALGVAGALAVVKIGLVPVVVIGGSLMLSVLIHESAHILGLRVWGDPTPKEAGRDTLNPLKHISMVGTVLVPAVSIAISVATIGFPVLFGWGRPVPVDFNRLKNPKTDAAKVAMLGPASNLLLAAVAGLALVALPAGGVAALVASTLFKMNLALTLFNLLPLPHLDGGKLLVSLLPKSAYARWTHNPNLKTEYQGLYQRIYEGPSNLLSKLHVHSLEHVNGLTRVVSLAALAAFYAVFFSALSVPLLFMALPCSYDYWCIREKVRSEAAVKDLMDIMSQWSTVIVQIAEDLKVESEVSAYETEHAMKNALETIIDELMEKEEFRALTDEEKIEAVMKAYPDKAAEFMKDKAMTEDTLETIKKVLADDRNKPFTHRLRNWMRDHEIFKKWGNKHSQEKLKESLKEADKGKKQSNGGGSGTTLGVLAILGFGLGSSLFPDAAAAFMAALTGIAGMAGMAGGHYSGPSNGDLFDNEGEDWTRKVRSHGEQSRSLTSIVIWFVDVPGDDADMAVGVDELLRAASSQDRLADGSYLLNFTRAKDAADFARDAADSPLVQRVEVHPGVAEILHLPGAVEQADGDAEASAAPGLAKSVLKLASNPRVKPGQLWVEAEERSAVDETLSELGFSKIEGPQNDGSVWRFPENADVPALALQIAGYSSVTGVTLSDDIYTAATLRVSGKVTSEGFDSEHRLRVILQLKPGIHDQEDHPVNVLIRGYTTGAGSVVNDLKTIFVDSIEEAAAAARKFAAQDGVARVLVHPAVEGKILRPKPQPWGDADPERSLLIQFTEDASRSNLEAYAVTNDLRLVDAEYRGGVNLGLFELPERMSLSEGLATLNARISNGLDGKVVTIRPLREVSPEAVKTVEEKPSQAQPEPEQPVQPRQRDVQAAWIDFLNNRTLIDGKSTLTPKQAQVLAAFLKPMKAKSDAPTPPVVGRLKEIKRIIPIITSPRGMRNSVIIVGEAGVGKTAIYEGLAQLIEEAENPAAGDYLDLKRLKGRFLVELDLDELLSSDDPVGALKAVLQLLPLLNDADPGAGNKVMVVMDEIQKLFLDQAGTKLANSLKTILRDGRLSALAATTEKEYKKWIEPDDAFRRRFELVRADEPTVEETISMLRGMKEYLQKLHEALIPDEALVAAAKLHHQFDKSNFNPDKSVKGVQDSAELSRPDNLRASISLDIRQTWQELQAAVYAARQELLDKGIASAVALPLEAYNKLAGLSRRAAQLYEELAAVEDGKGRVTVDVIKRNLTAKTGIASGQLSLGEEDTSRYVQMEAEINKSVVAQERAIKALASAIRRNKAGISDPSKPMAKYLFVGPTGTGKTHLAKRLAHFLFHDEEAMIRVDMSEYMEKHEVAKLVGAPPGYVGYGEGGQLTEKVRKKPYSVILFDEIEKAHPDVWNILLQVLDDGRLTDGEGRVIDFRNTVILLSSNIGMGNVDGQKYEAMLAGAKNNEERAKIEEAWDAEIAEAIKQTIPQAFRPEFINRLDEDPTSKNKYVIFERLKPQHMGKIARLELAAFQRLLNQVHGTELVVAEEVYDLLAQEGFSALYGARPMKSTINKLIVDPLAEWILSEITRGRSEVRGGLIRVGIKDGNLLFEALPKPEKVVERLTVAGAAEALVEGVLKLVEGQDSFGPEALEKLLKGPETAAERGKQTSTPEAGGYKPARPAPSFEGEGTAVSAQHNNPGKKDDDMRYLAKTLPEAAKEALWPEAVVSLVEPGAGQVGVGWLKHFIKHAKEKATKAGAAAPITVLHKINGETLRIAIISTHKMKDDERLLLDSHFSGAPTASYLAAQQKADNLNLNSAMIWDHNLLDLYRRLSAEPGASWGWSVGPEGTTYWIEVKRQQAAAASGQASLTPHQKRENEKIRSLFWRVVSSEKQDGHAMRIAASRGFVELSGPEQVAEMRQKLQEGGYARHGGTQSKIQQDWGVVMTAVGVLGRFGTRDDIPVIEVLAQRLISSAHDVVPLHNAFVEALTELYTRAGLAEAKAAFNRSENSDIQRAARRAFGRVGGKSELKEIVNDGEAYADYTLRHGGRIDLELVGSDRWEKLPAEERIAHLRVIAKTGGAEFLPRLGKLMTKDFGRSTKYNVALAWAEICARLGLTSGLASAMGRYLDKRTLTAYDDDWEYFLALLYLAELAGDADTLALVEEAMSRDAHQISSRHEQSYFSLPMTWAALVVNNGLFPDRLQKITAMLASHKPMEAAAAVYALALARQPRRRAKAAPTGTVPPQEAPSPSSRTSDDWEGGGGL